VQDEEKVYKEIVRRIQKVFDYDHVAVYVLDQRQNVLVLKTLSGKYRGITPDGQTIPLDQGIVGWVASHGKTLLSNDVSRTPFFLNITPALIPTKAELCVPIRVDGELLGVLNIEHSELLYFDDDDINGIEVLADRIGVAIRNSQLYAELERSYNRLQEVVSSIGQGLMMIDRNFRVLWLNKTLREWGFERAVGQFCYTMFGHGADYCRNCSGYRTMQTGLPYKDVIKAHGDRHYSIASAPITDSAGNVTHVLEAFDDITDALNTRHELQFLKGELERSQELASLGELTASIVHEVRNPVNAMVQAVSILDAELPLDQEQRQLMEVLKEECNRLETTLNAFLSRTPRPPRTMEEASLRGVVERVISLLSADQTVTRWIRFVVEIPASVPAVKMHVNSITQVFWNLLLNAVESIDGQGVVKIGCRLDDSCIHLSVEDTGRGLGETDINRLFDPFFTTKEKGTGLGLAIVKRVLDDHGWSIHALPLAAGGTCFTIDIPGPMTHPGAGDENPRR
jgi:nitrogen-specific signal transduction histidine kinase/putative methionine-R-sulfoxide reductase with GAF domain